MNNGCMKCSPASMPLLFTPNGIRVYQHFIGNKYLAGKQFDLIALNLKIIFQLWK
jgi:hypothetical protein